MSKVVLSLGNGSLQNGFPAVTVHLWRTTPHPMRFTGGLPAAPEIRQLYRDWQLLYKALYRRLDLSTRIEINAADVTNVSEVEFSDLCRQLSDKINRWLHSELFRNIDQQLRTHLNPCEEIQFIIETKNPLLRRLPWHLWNFFEHYPKAEVALSPETYQSSNGYPNQKYGNKVRILAILGNAEGIDLESDKILIQQLSNRVEAKFLIQPSSGQLNNQLWEQGWDILFFAGHSSSEEKGWVHLNETDRFTLDRFRNGLKKAIERGLKLAIFNSCDSLGLAQQLEDLHIPQVIAMREPVPDAIAQEFLRYFLKAFSGGQSLYAAVREARERLQKLEDKYPCATWLPVICQNPAEEPITWQLLSGLTDKNRPSWQSSIQTALVASVMVTGLVMGMRSQGILQQVELQAFDRMMTLRPNEPPDPRLLIVTVTEKDVQNQNSHERRGASLSDSTLTKLLEKIQRYQPQIIGLDIYRDFPTNQKDGKLATYFKQNQRLIGVCEVGLNEEDNGIKPPPEISKNRLSFSDFAVDDDGVIRRHLLGISPAPKSFCVTDTSFSFRVAQTYLASKGIQSKLNQNGDLSIGNIPFKQLERQSGGYYQLDARGYQLLLNWRSSHTVAQQISVGEILSSSIASQLPNLIKGRIVLIGTTAKSFKDYHPTPYSANQQSEKMSGVIIHAQMISQILSAVLDKRPLLWWWPIWGEILWVWGWSFVGGVLASYFRMPLRLGIASGVAVISLCGLCFVFLLRGGWVPLVPSVLALAVTGGSVVVWIVFQNKQKPVDF